MAFKLLSLLKTAKRSIETGFKRLSKKTKRALKLRPNKNLYIQIKDEPETPTSSLLQQQDNLSCSFQQLVGSSWFEEPFFSGPSLEGSVVSTFIQAGEERLSEEQLLNEEFILTGHRLLKKLGQGSFGKVCSSCCFIVRSSLQAELAPMTFLQ
jgi:hypothetical protein